VAMRLRRPHDVHAFPSYPTQAKFPELICLSPNCFLCSSSQSPIAILENGIAEKPARQ
jgi:hypothetical protein